MYVTEKEVSKDSHEWFTHNVYQKERSGAQRRTLSFFITPIQKLRLPIWLFWCVL